jgi:hypothetical protein
MPPKLGKVCFPGGEETCFGGKYQVLDVLSSRYEKRVVLGNSAFKAVAFYPALFKGDF